MNLSLLLNPLASIWKSRENRKIAEQKTASDIAVIAGKVEIAKVAGEASIVIKLVELQSLIVRETSRQLAGTWKDEYVTVVASLFIVVTLFAGLLYPTQPEFVNGLEKAIETLVKFDETNFGKACVVILCAAAGVSLKSKFNR